MALPQARNAPAQKESRKRWGDHEGAVLDSVGGYDAIACEACGFVHVVPLPDESELASIYKENYYAETKPDYLVRAREDDPWARLSFDDRLDLLTSHLPASRRRLLDIGSGPGFFAQRAIERGFATEGIDPSRQACAHARSLDVPVTEGFYDDEAVKKLGTFDAITLTNMLEHVADPIALLTRASKSLSSGGLICVTVPNDYNQLQETLRRGVGLKPWWVAPPHHLNYFTFSSLSNLLSRVGFKELARSTSFPMELFALMGDIYIGDDALGRACHKKRVNFDLSFAKAGIPEVRKLIYAALAEVDLGREAILIAQKTS